MKEKHWTQWKRSQFEELPHRKWDEVIEGVTGFVILPRKTHHDSGYRQMDIVPIKDDKPFCRCGGCSDVLHLGGIGGYNKMYENTKVFPYDFNIDCLPVSGLLRVFMNNYTMTIGVDISSLEIFCKEVVK